MQVGVTTGRGRSNSRSAQSASSSATKGKGVTPAPDNANPLRAENARLREALKGLSELCDLVPIFQLDHGKSSVRAVRLAGKFVSATKKARDALLAKPCK